MNAPRSAGPDHLARGRVLYELRRYDLAAAEFEAAVAAEPNAPDPPAWWSLAFVCLGRPDAAEWAARKAVAAGPDRWLGHLALGYAYLAQGRLRDADRAGLEAARLAPWCPDPHILRAESAACDDDWHSAIEHAAAASAASPLDTRAAVIRGKGLIRLGRSNEAFEPLRAAVRHDPDDAALHETLGWALLASGRGGEAFPHLRESLRLNPHSERARAGAIEALRARNRVYAAMLRVLLWVHRRRLGSPPMLLCAGTAWFLAGFAVAVFWPPAIRGTVAGLAAAAAFILAQNLSVSFFDLLLLTRRDGRLLISGRQRRAAVAVAACFAAAGVMGLAALTVTRAFLVPAVPAATVLPYVAGAVIRSPEGPRRAYGRFPLLPALVATEVGLAGGVAAEAAGLAEDVIVLSFAVATIGTFLSAIFGFFWIAHPAPTSDPFEAVISR